MKLIWIQPILQPLKKICKYTKKMLQRFLYANEGFTQFLTEDEKRKIIQSINTDGGIIKNCINLYYSGKIALASKRIKKLLERIIKEDVTGIIKSDLDRNYSTRLVAYYPFLNNADRKVAEQLAANELTFFRARKEYYVDYKEMYHIPLNRRNLVGTERFSVPGIPCLYLGTSAYDVWLEMGRPAYSDFNVSAIKMKESGKRLQVLNLTATPYLLLGASSNIGECK